MKQAHRETLDIGAVHAWLATQVADLGAPPEVTRFSGGASNWTYRLRYERHDFVLRRPPAGTKAKSSHDMRREFEVQRALAGPFPYVADMVALCQDPSILGCDFYVMRHVPGIVPRTALDLPLDRDGVERLGDRFVDLWVDLHGVSPGSADLAGLGRGEGYVRRQIEGWSERYRRARTWNVPRLEGVMRWLVERAPDDAGASVIHNDFRLDNLVLDPQDATRVVAVLDWEMATIGDPFMDLGAGLAYWVEAGDGRLAKSTRRQPSDLAGMPSRREIVERYLKRSGRELPVPFVFYEVYGLFRLAAIAQQIYFRYSRGETRNPAFRNFWLIVGYLGWRARRAIAGR